MKTKAHLVFPQNILEELERERFLKTLDETKGAWSDKHHAALRSERDMEQYLREKRGSHRKRLRRIINE